MAASSNSSTKTDNVQNSVEELKIESLFNFSRWPSGWKLFFLCVYFPFGVVLAILRVFIGLHVFILSFLLRHSGTGRSILRAMCVILGVVVVEEGDRTNSSRVIVANHISPLDFFAVALARCCVLPTTLEMPELCQRMFGVINLGLRNGRETLIKNAKTYCAGERGSAQPLLTFPEGTMTNGKAGWLKFNSWPFSLDTPVQPLVIRLRRPNFVDVVPTTVGSGLLADVFWFLCVPFTVFEISWLPEMKMDKGETSESFTRKVETAMAGKAGVKSTNFTSHDAFEFAKRHILERAARANNWNNGRASHPYDHLAARVKEIVPQVPLNIIISDLERTGGSLDATMANILEGRVSYTPEEVQSPLIQTIQKTMPKVSTNDPSSWREIFDVRKKDMLETHRRRYLARKGFGLRPNIKAPDRLGFDDK